MAKRLIVLVGMLAVLLVATVPALAQGVPPGTPGAIEVTGVVEALGPKADGTPVFGITDEASGRGYILESDSFDDIVGVRVGVSGIPRTGPTGERILEVVGIMPLVTPDPSEQQPGEAATLSFELTVEGEPPEGTRFFGAPGEGGGQFFDVEGNRLGPVPLTDPDGDGTYTGSTTLVNPGTGPVVSLPIQIVRENGGDIETIRDFGVVPVDGDETFSASVSFEDEGPDEGEGITAAFELAVEGEPPEGTEFFYAIGQGQLFPLTDPDGDGTYTGSRELVSRVLPIQTLPVQILQSNADGTREVIRDFGLVTFDVNGEDQTFEASVSFEDGQEPRPGEEVTTTGVLRESGNDCNECAKHAITDETSGKTYYLISDPQSPFGDYVDLDSYVGQRVTISGILQMQGLNNLYVTSIESVGGSGGNGGSDNSGSDNGEGSGNGGSDGSGNNGGSGNSEGSGSGSGVSGGSSGSGGSGSGGSGGGILSGATGGVRGLLPSTGGGVTLAVLGAGVLLVAGGLLVRRIFR